MIMVQINLVISIVTALIIGILLLIEKIKKKELKTIDIDGFIEKHYKKILIIFLVLIFITRIYRFGDLPKAINVDEAGAAYDAYNIANYGVDRYLNSFPVYLINFGGGQSALYAYLNVLLIKITGLDNILISRLPELILFIAAIFVGYKLVEKMHDKKTGLLFAFLIIITPWQIVYSRTGLDCNLFGPMFIITLYLMQNAKKTYHYIFAGISFGLTLYTYAISYLIMPVFLFIWLMYNCYFKKITIKQTIIFLITILIFALPLIYFVFLNLGLFTRTNFGIFTIPQFLGFRSGEVRFSNLWKYGITSLNSIFLSRNTLYYIEIPFFIIGLLIGLIHAIKTFKKEEYSFLTLMTMIFLGITITNLIIYIQTNTRANLLYLPILYFTTIGILGIIKNKKLLWIITITAFSMLFIAYEIHYYSYFAVIERNKFCDITINEAIDYINNNNIKQENIYLYTNNKEQPYIYIVLKNKMSPYEFYYNYEEVATPGKLFTNKFRVGNIYCLNTEEIEDYHTDRVYIVDKSFTITNSILEKLEYEKVELTGYNIYYSK